MKVKKLLEYLSTIGLNILLVIVRNLWRVFKFALINKYVRCTLIIFWTIWPIIIILIFSHLALHLMEQIRDLLDSLVQKQSYSGYAVVGVFIFGLLTWYCTTILFLLKNQQEIAEFHDDTGTELTQNVVELKEKLSRLGNLPSYSLIDTRTLGLFIFYIPFLLGVVPFLSFLTALNTIQNSGLLKFAVVLMILVYSAIVYNWRHFSSSLEPNMQVHSFNSLTHTHKSIIRIGTYFVLVIIIGTTIKAFVIFISSAIGPIGVIYLSMSIWLIIGSYFNFLDYRYHTPFTVICLCLMMLFNNNNHQIRTISTKNSYTRKDDNNSLPLHFVRWIRHLQRYRIENKLTASDTIPIPIYLIATEGGGIRSAYWTAAVLSKLDSSNKHFFRHVYAISGVSGGSVGATIFTAQHRDVKRNPKYSFNVDRYFQNDFLSPVLTAFLIPDLLQKFSPFAINSLDRAVYLEDSWESAYSFNKQNDELGALNPFNTLSEPFMDLWRPMKDTSELEIPLLFLNSTNVEMGIKGVLTPVSIANNSNFKNVIDIQESVYRHIPLKTAASMSARFPIVTPPATTQVINEPWKDSANFVDGGYIDNSGTTTLLSILSTLIHSDFVRRELRRKFVINIITINNSSEFDVRTPDALNGSYEIKAPLQAFFKSWDNSAEARQYAVGEYLTALSGEFQSKDTSYHRVTFINSNPYSFNLDRKTGIIPLGWDLSVSAEKRIREQAERLPLTLRGAERYKGLFNGIEGIN
jgi:hypothetical protein